MKGWKGPPLGWRIIHNPKVEEVGVKVEVIEEEEIVDGLVLSDDTIVIRWDIYPKTAHFLTGLDVIIVKPSAMQLKIAQIRFRRAEIPYDAKA